MPISEATYERVALEDDEGKWELVCGRLREKPPMTNAHQGVVWTLAAELTIQLPRQEYAVGQESPKLRVPNGDYRIPDVCVAPQDLIRRRRAEHPHAFEALREPMPLVVEVWSPSTGDTDAEQKLLEYQERGDLEIWYIHPFDRTLRAWRHQPDGSYTETLSFEGSIRSAFLPNVTIELEALFE